MNQTGRWRKKLHWKKTAAVFLLLFIFICVLFTDLALRQKGQSYQELWEKCSRNFAASGMSCLLEELLPVYDFLDQSSLEAGIFTELTQTFLPGQEYIAEQSTSFQKAKEKMAEKTRKEIGEETAVVIDYDEMVYEENNTDSQEVVSNSGESGISEESGTSEKSENAAGEDDTADNAGYDEKSYIAAESYYEDTMTGVLSENEAAEKLLENEAVIEELKEKKSTKYLLSNFYIVDGSTSVDKQVFDVGTLLNKDMTMEKTDKADSPQIYIYHTHASEDFADSRKGKVEDTVVGLGTILTDILENTYGYQVYHDTSKYDIVNGSLDRNKAYNQAAAGIEKAMKKYPSIEVLIDLHRDSGSRRVTEINGKKTAQMMLFNGISRNKNGDIEYLYNANLQGNLAFSLQLKLAAMSLYADFAKPIYIKGYRYNLHYKEKSLLIELGTDHNTVEEAENAMEPLGRVLDLVLAGNE